MKKPLLWNTLAEIADFLAAETGEQWTERAILDLVTMEHATRPKEWPDGRPRTPGPTLLSAALPTKATVTRVCMGGLDAPPPRPLPYVATAPLFAVHVAVLLARGETTIERADPPDEGGPDDPVSAFRDVIQPPAGVTLAAVRASAADVIALTRFAKGRAATPAAAPPPVAPEAAAESVSAIISERARRAAGEAHKENRRMHKDAIAHYRAHRSEYANKDRAAEAIAGKIVPAKFSTVRRWLRNI